MNIAETEVRSMIIAKTCGCKDSRKVAYTFTDQYHSLCLDKRDVIMAEMDACERLLKYAQDETDRCVVEKEITKLKMALDLMP
jgi:hypothetical protein